jgi:hypothetical protein
LCCRAATAGADEDGEVEALLSRGCAAGAPLPLQPAMHSISVARPATATHGLFTVISPGFADPDGGSTTVMLTVFENQSSSCQRKSQYQVLLFSLCIAPISK